MIDKIYTGTDKAVQDAAVESRATYQTHRERMLFDFNIFISPAFRYKDIPIWSGAEGDDFPLYAFISSGRWLVQCDICSGVEYADPDDPIMFCHECGNRLTEGRSRPVIFPDNRAEVEAEVLKNEVIVDDNFAPYGEIGMARTATPVDKSRDWIPQVLIDNLDFTLVSAVNDTPEGK